MRLWCTVTVAKFWCRYILWKKNPLVLSIWKYLLWLCIDSIFDISTWYFLSWFGFIWKSGCIIFSVWNNKNGRNWKGKQIHNSFPRFPCKREMKQNVTHAFHFRVSPYKFQNLGSSVSVRTHKSFTFMCWPLSVGERVQLHYSLSYSSVELLTKTELYVFLNIFSFDHYKAPSEEVIRWSCRKSILVLQI